MPPADHFEKRFAAEPLELRAAANANGGPREISGYAARFGVLSEDLGGFREIIAPGAFSKALGKSDIRALINHESWPVLARTKSGTLEVIEDAVGLFFRFTPPDTPNARELEASIDRGDAAETSFAFTVAVDEWDVRGAVPIRTIREVRELFDVSVVTWAAYAAADAQLALRSLEAHKAEQAPAPPPPTPRKDALAPLLPGPK